MKQAESELSIRSDLQSLNDSRGKQSEESLEKKVQELDREIEAFKQQNEALSAVQRDCEAQLARVNRQIEDFERRKDSETRDFEDWKARERAAIATERAEVEALRV